MLHMNNSFLIILILKFLSSLIVFSKTYVSLSQLTVLTSPKHVQKQFVFTGIAIPNESQFSSSNETLFKTYPTYVSYEFLKELILLLTATSTLLQSKNI